MCPPEKRQDSDRLRRRQCVLSSPLCWASISRKMGVFRESPSGDYESRPSLPKPEAVDLCSQNVTKSQIERCDPAQKGPLRTQPLVTPALRLFGIRNK